MGFLSFGKKKKADAATVPSLPPKRLSRSSRPANNASTTSTMSATSSGSSSGSPPQAPPVHQEPQRRSLSLAPSRPSGASAAHDVPPVPLIPTSAPAASSSSSLGVPNAPYANRELAKKASTNTLNLTRRGPHSAPPLADCLAKPRSASYHAPQHRNIWVTSASTHGHSMIAANSAVDSKFHSTGGPMVGSYYGDAQFPQQSVSDQEFKFYTKNYDTAISKAHSLAREYHHLPPAKRDRQRFEHVGQSFAAAARLSREHWSYRCHLEKERLETLVASGARMSQADVYAQDLSPHRIAGMRATEGWQYASMLADAWGAKEEMATPLEDMLTLKPNHPTSSLSGAPSSFTDLGYSSGYMHPGYAPSVFASYATQAVDPTFEPAVPSTQTRSRMDSTASKASEAYSTSTHTHTGVSYTLRHSQSHGALSSSGNPIKGYSSGPLNQSKSKPDLSDSPEPIPPLPTSAPVGRTSFSTIEEPITRPPIIKLTKGRRYKERASEAAPTAVAVS